MKKNLLAVIGLLLILSVVACDDRISNEKEAQDIEEMVHDYSVGNFDDVSASITSHELIVTDSGNKEMSYELPEENFFVSFSPFIVKTHDCSIHILTDC